MLYFQRPADKPGTSVPEGSSGLGVSVHPNPWRPNATVWLSADAPRRVRIRVFDVAGRLVRSLFEGWIDAGRRSIDWDGTADDGNPVTSGVYFVVAESEGGAATRKTVLLR